MSVKGGEGAEEGHGGSLDKVRVIRKLGRLLFLPPPHSEQNTPNALFSVPLAEADLRKEPGGCVVRMSRRGAAEVWL